MFAKQAVRSSIVALALTGLTAAPGVARPEAAPVTPSQPAVVAHMYKNYGENGATGDVAPSTPRTPASQDLRSPDSADAASPQGSVPPRTEGMGVQPQQHGPYASTRPAPLVKAQALRTAGDTNSVDWTSVLVGASIAGAMLMAAFLGRSLLRRGHVARVG
jgi:hypothetical protein